jgi:hypothetical protein
MSTQDSDGSNGVFGQLIDTTGQKIGNEFEVNTYTTSTQQRPRVAAWQNGNFIVAWGSDGQDGSGYGIYSQMYNTTGSKIGNEFQINSFCPIRSKFTISYVF